MTVSPPPSLRWRRGLRWWFLHRLPGQWYRRPPVREAPIPVLDRPSAGAVPLITCSATTVRFDLRAYAESLVVLPLPLAFDVYVKAPSLGRFDVRVFGILFRTRERPSDEITAAADAFGIDRSLPHARELTAAARERNPYSGLYAQLYPPPEEVTLDLTPDCERLHNYQVEGIRFLVEHEHAMLADDMGLGKTAQCSIATAILMRSERLRRVLIICPKSLVYQWLDEASRWAGLIARPIEGTAWERCHQWANYPGVVVATPNIVLNDIEVVRKQDFDLVVCDDVSMLKNPGKITSAIRSIPRERSWCLSGTPLENKPEDLANVMEFVHKGLFSADEREVAPPLDVVQARVRPFFLRRRKTDVLKDLPRKVVGEPVTLHMRSHQLQAYRRAERQRWESYESGSLTLTRVHVFALINELLQICSFHKESGESAKAEEVGEQLEIVFDSDASNKAIIFTRWIDTLHFLERRWCHFSPLVYHGGMSAGDRKDVLEKFRKSARLLLMSVKAAGRGLNLQEASYVYHFDLTWNPMDQRQAEDRCWRYGQKKTVFVYSYVQKGTIEERIHQVLRRKSVMFGDYVDTLAEDTDETVKAKWSIEELIELLRPSTIPSRSSDL